jgi:O-antigen/teichoic acid export membrane protein
MRALLQYFRRDAARKYAANTAWLLAEKCWTLSLTLLATVVVARHLGVATFGALQYAASLCGLVALVATLGLDSILVRELVKQPERSGDLLGTAALLRSCAALVVVAVLALTAVGGSGGGGVKWLPFVIGLALVPQAASVIDFLFQSRVDARWSSLSRALAVACGISFILLGANTNAGPLYFAWQPLLEASVTALSLWLCLRRLDGRRTPFRFDVQLARTLLRESWPLMFAMSLISLHSNIDRVMVKMMLGNEATGLYSAAAKLSEGWYFLPTIIVSSVFPALVRAGSWPRSTVRAFARPARY